MNSTDWFRLRFAQHYHDTRQPEKAIEIYRKILRKNDLFDRGALISREKFIPKTPEDFFYVYYVRQYTEKLADFVIEQKEKDFIEQLPERYARSPSWRYAYAASLARHQRWDESVDVLEYLQKEYSYLSDISLALTRLKERRVLENSIPILGLWSFDEEEGFVLEDSSGHGHSGRSSGAVRVKGVVGTALEFDGKNDNVKIPHSDAFNRKTNEDFTIGFWIKADMIKQWAGVIHKHRYARDSSGRVGWTVAWQNGRMQIMMNDGVSSFNKEIMGQKLGLNWNHCVLVFDRDKAIILYVNGKEAGRLEADKAQGDLSNEEYLTFGQGPWGFGDRVFSGWIDEVKMFSKVLTPEEVEIFFKTAKQ